MKTILTILCVLSAMCAVGAVKKPSAKKTSFTEAELRTLATSVPSVKNASMLHSVAMSTSNNVERKQAYLKAAASCLIACDKNNIYEKHIKGKLLDVEKFESELRDDCERCYGTGAKRRSCYFCKGTGRCMPCKGSGEVAKLAFDRKDATKPCRKCTGSGSCAYCRGKGLTKEKCMTCAGAGKVLRKEVAARAYRESCNAIADNMAEKVRTKIDAEERERRCIAAEAKAKDGRSCVQLWADGPYWAETNIGATRPEEAGLYFWWGDTKGQMPSGGSFHVSFNKDNCTTADKSESDLKSAGWLTNGGTLVPEHDAAHINWGGTWRMPTKRDFQNLLDNCYWIWTFKNGVKGYDIRGKGAFSGASIFLPCTCSGMRYSLTPEDSSCFYWSSDRNTFFVDFNFETRGVSKLFQACVGLPIRPVTSECTRSASELQALAGLIKNEQEAQSECLEGLEYTYGTGSINMTKAFECYLRAAKLGSDSAQFQLGLLYRDGKGVKKDLQKSVEWYDKAAEQGNPIAQFSLGCCYLMGRGVDEDSEEALKWLRKAAQQGHEFARETLRKLRQDW